MEGFKRLQEYTAKEINSVLDLLRKEYDIVRLVDVEECRIFEVNEDGSVHYKNECHEIWGRKERCRSCTSYRACKTHSCMDKVELLGDDALAIHSIPVYLRYNSGEVETCVIECVAKAGDGAVAEKPFLTLDPSHDILTGLYNSEEVLRKIRKRLITEDARDYYLTVLNVRNFRLVNRLFGIEGGNVLLTGIADMLKKNCTDQEIYGRFKDDRFVILIRKDRFNEVYFLKNMMKGEKILESPIHNVSFKLGVYPIPDADMPVYSMVEHAVLAVESIRDIRQQKIAYYDERMMERKLHIQKVIDEFEASLKDGEFVPYLQPQVTAEGKFVGAEVLVRWAHPDGTVSLPGEFLGILQQSELLSILDRHIWEMAAQRLAQWKGSVFEKYYLSVNVDPTEFFYMDVPRVLRGICERNGVDTEKLHIEITESSLIEDRENETNIVRRLHEYGFIVEIDDFGKGASSLSFLNEIDADVLKIDMGFVQGSSTNERSRIIARAVVEMAEKLNMEIITEGIETEEQLEIFSGIGCRVFQGFYFSKALPVKEFEVIATVTKGNAAYGKSDKDCAS